MKGAKRKRRRARGKHRGHRVQALKLVPLSLRTAQHSTMVNIRPRICNTAMPRPMAQTRTRLLYRPFQRAVPQPCVCRPCSREPPPPNWRLMSQVVESSSTQHERGTWYAPRARMPASTEAARPPCSDAFWLMRA
uniref:Uncharacterized protein n=1 Tax=Rhipicephalus microplus TaxID=6941 RepID=A0A6G5AG03_RHIMP